MKYLQKIFFIDRSYTLISLLSEQFFQNRNNAKGFLELASYLFNPGAAGSEQKGWQQY